MERLMHAFARLRNDVDLFRIWYVAIIVTAVFTVMNLFYGEYINGWMFLRGTPETVLALLAARGRRWARFALGLFLAGSAASAGYLLSALPGLDVVQELVYFTYATGMSLAAAKAWRLF
jgi:hypothetical protein